MLGTSAGNQLDLEQIATERVFMVCRRPVFIAFYDLIHLADSQREKYPDLPSILGYEILDRHNESKKLNSGEKIDPSKKIKKLQLSKYTDNKTLNHQLIKVINHKSTFCFCFQIYNDKSIVFYKLVESDPKDQQQNLSAPTEDWLKSSGLEGPASGTEYEFKYLTEVDRRVIGKKDFLDVFFIDEKFLGILMSNALVFYNISVKKAYRYQFTEFNDLSKRSNFLRFTYVGSRRRLIFRYLKRSKRDLTHWKDISGCIEIGPIFKEVKQYNQRKMKYEVALDWEEPSQKALGKRQVAQLKTNLLEDEDGDEEVKGGEDVVEETDTGGESGQGLFDGFVDEEEEEKMNTK